MNTIYKYIALLVLVFVGCTSSEDDGGALQSTGEFSATVSITRSGSDGDSDSDLLDSGVLKIYNSDGGLVRYYAAVSGEFIDYLASGSYYATYRAGVYNEASFDDDLYYYGESDVVDIVPKYYSRFNVEATVQNTILTIKFDDVTLASHFSEYSVEVYAANSVAEVNEDTPTLTYSVDANGYFILPDGVKNMVWKFIGDGSEIQTGILTSTQKAYQYTLSFKYSYYLLVSGISLNFEDIVYSDDIFDFKVQPVIKALDFEEDEVQDILAKSNYELSITSLSPLVAVNVMMGGSLYDATFTDDATSSTDNVVYDNSTQTLYLREGLFAAMNSGDYYNVAVVATAENGAYDELNVEVGISGFAGVVDEDFWAATTKMQWYTTTPSQSVQMRFRQKGNSEWFGTYEATSTNGNLWSAESDVEWSAAITNDYSNTMYQYLDGYLPAIDYEYQAIIDGEESYVADLTSSDASLSIPYSNFSDSSLSCYTTSNANAEFWASGNNSTTSSLCTYDSTNGCPYLSTTSAYGVIAAGNLLSGTFAMTSGTKGTASFGQPFDWNVRPKSFSFRYKATVGSDDKCRVYVAIVDWSSRHGVTSGLGDPSGVWDPESDMSVDEGQVIGYANIHIENTVSSFTEIELPIYYYDKKAVPTAKYQIAIMATSSYKGEYTSGSTSSELWVDDFKFNY
ncbi:MAG: PCMD domain-containing protein [Rikenellaceae bacterium]